MVELKPMLLSEVQYDDKVFDDYKDWYWQEKANGVRALVHVKNNRIIGIRNRSNAPVLFCFPEFRGLEIRSDETILDAEIVVLKNGKSVYYGGIDRRRSVPSQKTLKENPATIVVFDALKLDGEVLLMKPYEYRYEKLKNALFECERLKIAKNYEDPKELWKEVIKKNLEGVVLKKPLSPYEMGVRTKNQIKIKNYKECFMTVESTEPNSKGTKVIGKALINGEIIEVEAQMMNETDIAKGDKKKIRYLDIVGKRLVQPTRGR